MLDTRYPVRLSRAQRRMLAVVARADGRKPAGWVRRQIELAYAELARQRANAKEYPQ